MNKCLSKEKQGALRRMMGHVCGTWSRAEEGACSGAGTDPPGKGFLTGDLRPPSGQDGTLPRWLQDSAFSFPLYCERMLSLRMFDAVWRRVQLCL